MDKNRMTVTNLLEGFSARADVERFLRVFHPNAASGAGEFEVIETAGGTTQQTSPNMAQAEDHTWEESDTDTEILLEIAWPTPLLIY
jgi:tripeptidyl-peptidase I